MSDFIIVTLYFLALLALCYVCFRLGREQGFEEAHFLKYDCMETAGRVLFISKTLDVDTIVISNGEKVITYRKDLEF